MPMYLEWDVIKAPVGVMCRRPNTFVHLVYIYIYTHTCSYPTVCLCSLSPVPGRLLWNDTNCAQERSDSSSYSYSSLICFYSSQ